VNLSGNTFVPSSNGGDDFVATLTAPSGTESKSSVDFSGYTSYFGSGNNGDYTPIRLKVTYAIPGGNTDFKTFEVKVYSTATLD
jgi:microcystin degradation protein MlrC